MAQQQRVLSIQSHVVRGHVGNKSAVFPLQTLGFDVDFINSVQFSNHTGYKNWTGQVLQENDLLQLYNGLKKNNLHLEYSHILTGYARSKSFLQAMFNVVNETKSLNPKAIYSKFYQIINKNCDWFSVCDPVLGDNGKLYVPAELVSIYRNELLPIADVITPNQFELEILSGVSVEDLTSAIKAIDKLHAIGPKTVVVSSIENLDANNILVIIVSSYHKNSSKRDLYQLNVTRFKASFTGVGDLFSALFLAWFTKTDFDVKKTLENTVCTLQVIIKRTYEFALQQPEAFSNPDNLELKIIQCRNDIDCPQVTNFATPISLPVKP